MSAVPKDDSRQLATLNRAWTAVLRVLAGKVSTASYEAYIRPIKPLSFDGDDVVLGVSSPFASEWIRKNYLAAIHTSLESALARKLHVRLRVLPNEVLPLFVQSEPEPLAQEARRPDPPPWIPSVELYPRFTFENFVV